MLQVRPGPSAKTICVNFIASRCPNRANFIVYRAAPTHLPPICKAKGLRERDSLTEVIPLVSDSPSTPKLRRAAFARERACQPKLGRSEGWRSRRDSNPRYAFGAYNGLANRRLQPLGHSSACGKAYAFAISASNSVLLELRLTLRDLAIQSPKLHLKRQHQSRLLLGSSG